MDTKKSAGILLYRMRNKLIEIFLVHPGGPFWSKKDEGCWTIPKGEYNEGENALEAAKREFEEETGTKLMGEFIGLTTVKQKGGKTVSAWAIEGNIDAENIRSNNFEMECPPKSGKKIGRASCRERVLVAV